MSAGALSPDRAQLLQIGAFGVGIIDWTSSQPPGGTQFVTPTFAVIDARGDDRHRWRRHRRHGGVREPADRRHRVRGAVVPDPRVLRPVGRVRRRRREGEPGHGAADLRGDRAAARHRQDRRHRARRAHAGEPRARARGGGAAAVRADRQRGPRTSRTRRRRSAGCRPACWSRSSCSSRSGSRCTRRSTPGRAR